MKPSPSIDLKSVVVGFWPFYTITRLNPSIRFLLKLAEFRPNLQWTYHFSTLGTPWFVTPLFMLYDLNSAKR
jgi:hypothetical protein